MAYGVINIKYGGAESTKFVEKDEFYKPMSVPSGTQVDLYINMEYYSMVKEDLENATHDLRSAKDSYSNAFKRQMDRMKERNHDLEKRLERANRVIDCMLERSE